MPANKVSEVVNKVAETVIDWTDWLKKAGKEGVAKKVVPKGLKRVDELKKRVNRLFNQQFQKPFELVKEKSALKEITTDYVIEGVDGYDPKSFLNAAKRAVTDFLKTIAG